MNSQSNNESVAIHNDLTSNSHSPPRLWPWIGYLIVALLFDACLHAFSYQVVWGTFGTTGVYAVLSIVIGCVVGQFLLVMVICSLWGKTWISGYAAAVGLLVTGVLSTNIGSRVFAGLARVYVENSILPAVYAIAALAIGVLFASAGCLAFRAFRGWRLTRQAVAPPFTPIGITDLIMGTALIALLVMIGNDVMALGLIGTENFWEPIVTLGAMAWVLSPTSILPSVWTVFRATRLRLLKLLFLVAANSTAFGLIGGLFLEYAETATEPFLTVFVWCTLGGIITYLHLVVGLYALRASGFHLHTGNPASGASTATDTRTYRAAIPAGVFGALLLAHLLFSSFAISNQTRANRFRQLQRDMAERGGQISEDSQGVVRSVKLQRAALREDLLKLMEYPQLQSLTLTESAIKDDTVDLLANFAQLRTLDLTGTAITDVGLEKLAKFKALEHLAIGGTKCTAAGIARLLESVSIGKLDLSDLQLNDEQLSQITENCSSLPHLFVLSRNSITNAGIAKLIRAQDASADAGVDLTDCSVDESCLVADSYTDLILDGTQVSELGLARKFKNLIVAGTLSMDRTSVSDSVLDFLALATVANLKLGETLITEKNLHKLGNASIRDLSLNSRKFTGSCFAQWKPEIQNLDMSHSGVTDENISHIAKLPDLFELNLRDTSITDMCLGVLSKSNLATIDLCETRVTAAGIAKQDWDGTELKVTAVQFSEAEFKYLLPLVRLTIEPPSPKAGVAK